MNSYLADISGRPRLVVRTGPTCSANWTDPGPPERQLVCEADTTTEALDNLLKALAARGIEAPEPEYLES